MSSTRNSCATCDGRIDVYGRDGVRCRLCNVEIELDDVRKELERLNDREAELLVEREELWAREAA